MREYKKAFTLIGMGIGFALWWYFNSFWLFLASMFVFMGFGLLLDIKKR
jgi:hypothetical protein